MEDSQIDHKTIKRNRRFFPCPLCEKKVKNLAEHVGQQHKVSKPLKFLLKYQHQGAVSCGAQRLRCPICFKCFGALHHHLALKHGLSGDELKENVKKAAVVKINGFRSKFNFHNAADQGIHGLSPLKIEPQNHVFDDLLSDFCCFLDSHDTLHNSSPQQRASHIKQLLIELKFKDLEDLINEAEIKSYFDKLIAECQQRQHSPGKTVRLRRPALVLANLNSFKFFAEFLLLRFPDNTKENLKLWLEASYPEYMKTVEGELESYKQERRVSFGDMSGSSEKKVERRGRKRKNPEAMPVSECYLAYLQSPDVKLLEHQMTMFAETKGDINLGVDIMALFTKFRDHMVVRVSVENTINPKVLKNFAMSCLLNSTEVDGLFYYTVPDGKLSTKLVIGGELVQLFAGYLIAREQFGRQNENCPFVFPAKDGSQMTVADTKDILYNAFKSESLRRSITTDTMRELASNVLLNTSNEGTAMVTRRKARGDGIQGRVGRPNKKKYYSYGDDDDYEEENGNKSVNNTFNSTVESDAALNQSDLDREERNASMLSFDGKKKRMAWNPNHLEKLKELFNEFVVKREVPTLTVLKSIVMSDKEFFNDLIIERDINRDDKADMTKLFYAILCRVKTFL